MATTPMVHVRVDQQIKAQAAETLASAAISCSCTSSMTAGSRA